MANAVANPVPIVLGQPRQSLVPGIFFITYRGVERAKPREDLPATTDLVDILSVVVPRFFNGRFAAKEVCDLCSSAWRVASRR